MPTYPLDVLLRLRSEAVERAKREWLVAAMTAQIASSVRSSAEDAVGLHERAVATVTKAERDALTRGELRVIDLVRAEAWSKSVVPKAEKLRSAVGRARLAEEDATRARQGMKHDLAARMADARVLEKDRAAWAEAVRKAADLHEEEASFEAWRPKR